MEEAVAMMIEEEAPEVGPNDIVIHLVNPYKCGVCELEFLDKGVFKDHMLAHLEHIKHEHPSSQIVINITLPPETPGGVTVTRDILQLGEDGTIKQVLQPANCINMNQVSPLRELEEAGVIKLEHPPQVTAASEVDLENPLPLDSFKEDGQQQRDQLHTNEVVAMDAATDIESLLKEGELKEGVSQIIANKDGSFSIAFKGPNNELQHVQVLRPAGMKGGLMVDLTNHQDRRKVLKVAANKSNECEICGKILSSSTNLLRHKMYHSAARPFRCEVCDKGFKDASNLKKHAMIHKRIFHCHLCTKSFQRKSLLAIHLMRHESRTAMVRTGNSTKEITLRTFIEEDGTRVEEMSMAALNGQTFEFKSRIVKAEPYVTNQSDDNSREEKDDADSIGKNKKEDEKEDESDGLIIDTTPKPVFTVTKEGLRLSTLDSADSTDESLVLSQRGNNTNLIMDVQELDEESKLKVQSLLTEFVKMYQCGHCGKRTVQRGNMMRHLIHHLKEKPYTCDECPKQFVDKGELVKHKKTHSKPYKCHQCHGAFAHNVQLTKHLQSECLGSQEQLKYTALGDSKTYKCNLCSIEMKRLGNMIKHVSSHNFNSGDSIWKSRRFLSSAKPASKPSIYDTTEEVKPNVSYYYDSQRQIFVCGYCSRGFSQKANVDRHMKVHSNEPWFPCEHCGRSFTSIEALNRHVQTHTKPFKCDQCNCSFSRKLFLDAHIKDHCDVDGRGDNPDYGLLENQGGYYCRHCDKKLNKRYRMMNHVKKHLNQRPFECETCNKCFSCQYLLQKHRKLHVKPIVCTSCGESFTNKLYLLLHRKKMHSFLKTVDDIKQEEDIKVKIESGTEECFFCKICRAPFSRLRIKANHEKKCEEESKVLIRLPDGKGYKCKLCKKVATLKHNLMVHIRKHSEASNDVIDLVNDSDNFIKTEVITDDMVVDDKEQLESIKNVLSMKTLKKKNPQKFSKPTVSEEKDNLASTPIQKLSANNPQKSLTGIPKKPAANKTQKSPANSSQKPPHNSQKSLAASFPQKPAANNPQKSLAGSPQKSAAMITQKSLASTPPNLPTSKTEVDNNSSSGRPSRAQKVPVRLLDFLP